MRSLKLKLIVFLSPLVLLFGITEFFYRITPNNYSVKKQYITNHSKDIEVVLFGDSHCFYGLNPIYFSKNTFNFSNVSQTIYFDKLLLEKYLDKLPELKQVIFCIEYTNLSQEDNTGDDVIRKYYYQHFMELEVPLISKFDPKQYSLTLTQSFDRTLDLYTRYFKTGTISDCNSNGWGNNYKKENRIPPIEVAELRAKIQEDGLINFDINTNRIKQIISECKQRNIQVFIVSMPQTNLFESYLNQKKLQKIIFTCSKFEKDNKENVHYLNLFNDKRFVDEDFFDADHLNDIGSIKCSKIVNKFINEFD